MQLLAVTGKQNTKNSHSIDLWKNFQKLSFIQLPWKLWETTNEKIICFAQLKYSCFTKVNSAADISLKKQKTTIFSNSSRLFLICRYISFCSCFSYIGRLGGKQTLSLVNGCLVERVIIHEFVHALGFFHEQSRPDRDTYIQVFLDRVQKGKLASLSLQLLRFKLILIFFYFLFTKFQRHFY